MNPYKYRAKVNKLFRTDKFICLTRKKQLLLLPVTRNQ